MASPVTSRLIGAATGETLRIGGPDAATPRYGSRSPGPLRSFARMAAIDSEGRPDEVLVCTRA